MVYKYCQAAALCGSNLISSSLVSSLPICLYIPVEARQLVLGGRAAGWINGVTGMSGIYGTDNRAGVPPRSLDIPNDSVRSEFYEPTFGSTATLQFGYDGFSLSWGFICDVFLANILPLNIFSYRRFATYVSVVSLWQHYLPPIIILAISLPRSSFEERISPHFRTYVPRA